MLQHAKCADGDKQAQTWILFWHSIGEHHGIADEWEQRDMQLHLYVVYIFWQHHAMVKAIGFWCKGRDAAGPAP